MLTWKKITRFLFGPRTELEFVEAALRRYQDELRDMEDDFDPAVDCCPDCMYGSHYSQLIDKIERVKLQRDRLKKKEAKQTEIFYVEASLKRYKKKLHSLKKIKDPDAMAKYDIDYWTRKVERVENWLTVLKKRKVNKNTK